MATSKHERHRCDVVKCQLATWTTNNLPVIWVIISDCISRIRQSLRARPNHLKFPFPFIFFRWRIRSGASYFRFMFHSPSKNASRISISLNGLAMRRWWWANYRFLFLCRAGCIGTSIFRYFYVYTAYARQLVSGQLALAVLKGSWLPFIGSFSSRQTTRSHLTRSRFN